MKTIRWTAKCAVCGRLRDAKNKWHKKKKVAKELLRLLGMVICPDCEPKRDESVLAFWGPI